jgi:hypothetical protein
MHKESEEIHFTLFAACVRASVVPSSPILVTLMEEALSYSETSDLTRATPRDIQEVGILCIKASFV